MSFYQRKVFIIPLIVFVIYFFGSAIFMEL